MPKPILTPKTLSALSQGNFYKIITTEEYSTWKAGLRDAVALRAIRARETRIAAGLWGDVKRIGKISELRVDVGPGYRIYFTIRGTEASSFYSAGTSEPSKQISLKLRVWQTWILRKSNDKHHKSQTV